VQGALMEASSDSETRILDVAANQLRRDGYNRLRVVAVAAEAGMSHGNVYRYFPSKEVLADAVLARWLKDIERGTLEAAGAPDPADDKLERMLSLVAQGYRALLNQDAKLFAVFADAAAQDRVIARRHRTRIRELLERALDEGMSTGIFPPGSRNAITAFVFDVAYRFIHPVAVQLDVRAPETQLRDRRDRCIDALLKGLKRQHFR
jgi:AcrR family transcriptional regulator